jgi:hypothetical protein
MRGESPGRESRERLARERRAVRLQREVARVEKADLSGSDRVRTPQLPRGPEEWGVLSPHCQSRPPNFSKTIARMMVLQKLATRVQGARRSRMANAISAGCVSNAERQCRGSGFQPGVRQTTPGALRRHCSGQHGTEWRGGVRRASSHTHCPDPAAGADPESEIGSAPAKAMPAPAKG